MTTCETCAVGTVPDDNKSACGKLTFLPIVYCHFVC